MQSQIIHSILQCLNRDYSEDILEESSWILCNLAAGSSDIVKHLASLGVIEQCIDLLEGVEENTLENLIWTIGNIAGDSDEQCEEVANSLFIDKLLEIYNTYDSLPGKILEITVWTLGNITKKKNKIPIDKCNSILHILKRLRSTRSTDEELYDWTKAVCGLAFKSELHCQAIIERGLLEPLLNLILHPYTAISTVAVRAIGIILSGTVLQAQILLNFHVLDFLRQKITSPCAEVRKEVLWSLSNITAGNPQQVSAVVGHGIIAEAVKALADTDVPARIEASWVMANIGVKGCAKDVTLLVDHGILGYLKENLGFPDQVIRANSLRITQCILCAAKIEEKVGVFSEFISVGCLDALLKVSYKAQGTLQNRIEEIISTYFERYSIIS